MHVEMPLKLLTRKEVISFMLDACVKCIAEEKTSTAYGYTKACDELSRNYHFSLVDFDKVSTPGSRLWMLTYALAQYVNSLTGDSVDVLVDKIFKDERSYERFLNSFCDDYSGSLKNWLSEKNGKINKSFETAVFFTYLMLLTSRSTAEQKKYLDQALSYLGISSVEEAVHHEMIKYNWESCTESNQSSESNNCLSANRAILTLAVINYTLLVAVGEDEKRQAPVERLHQFVLELYNEELKASAAMESAIHAWLNDVQQYEPRSIELTKSGVKPQDFYVYPRFEDSTGASVDPIAALANASASQRIIVRAKTGMGKTMFLHMASLCMLWKNMKPSSVNQALLDLAERISAPTDRYILFIPASMFSFCYSNRKYKNWTLDLVDLFFNCIFELSRSYNFYSGNNIQRYSVLQEDEKQVSYHSVSQAIRKQVAELAKQGRLVLLADSFDEIVAGEMRKAYVKALSRFVSTYCVPVGDDNIGAHVIITTREMSSETMQTLSNVLRVNSKTNEFAILPLTSEQSSLLIANWGRYYGETPLEINKTILGFASNHFCAEFAVNPYMLSVLCAKKGFAYDRVTQEFINALIAKLRLNYRAKNEVVIDILQSQNLLTILQNVALKTIENGINYFSEVELEKQIKTFISDEELSDNQIVEALQQLHELFVTAVGLIVPADGQDSAYQFINDQIRFFLAARGIRRELANYERRSSIYRNILESQDNVEGYVGLLIPLLSDLKDNADPELAEMLVSDLALRDSSEAEEPILVRAMIDLILGRYGANITTPSTVGKSDSGRATKRTQRILMLRLFSSSAFIPNEGEKLSIRRSPAYCFNKQLLRVEQTAILN